MSNINTAKNEEKDLEQQLEESSEVSITSSAFIEDSEPSVKYLLEEKEDRFLTKVGIVFIIYFTICFLVVLFIELQRRTAKEWYRVFRLNKLVWVYFSISLVLKVCFGFLGKWIRRFSKFAFLIDLFLTSLITLGLFFHLEEVQRQYFIAYGHYLIMSVICLYTMFIIFTISTLYGGTKKYNYWIGITVMTIANVSVLKLMDSFWITNPLKWDQFFKVFIVHFFVTIYVCINGYMVLNFRTKKFFNHEYFYCFFCFWVDWFSFFWVDIIKNIKFIKKKLRKRRRKNKKAKKKRERKEKKDKGDDLVIENEIMKISEIASKKLSKKGSINNVPKEEKRETIIKEKRKTIKESVVDFENYQKSNLD